MTPTKLGYQQQSTSGTAGVVDTNLHQVFPAQGPNLCNYLTDLQVYATAGASLYTVTILDGATPIFVANVNAASITAIAPYSFTTPLKGSPNTPMNIRFNSAAPTAVWNAQGFVAAANL